MTNKDIDPEIDAIKTLLEALSPLTPEIRRSVLSYVTQRLHISISNERQAPPTPLEGQTQTRPDPAVAEDTHIKILKDTKKPRSANEMAALVAYYLSEVVRAQSRKTTISLDDIKTYFKIAEFPLPTQPKMTLTNAKNAGYLDSSGEGSYKLNPVGYNLIVHSLPKDGSKAVTKKRKIKAPKKKSRG